MSIKNIASKIEKELARTTESYESLIETMREYISANMKTITDKITKCGDILDKEIKAKTKIPIKSINIKNKKSAGRITRTRKGLLNHLINILKENNSPLTQAGIAQILLDHPEKYDWKSKSEDALYQTLRRAVKEKKLVESNDRSRETKTYHVA